MTASPRVDLAIVIVSFNTSRLTIQCLRSLNECLQTTSHQIVLVDNNSSDDTVEAVQHQYPNVKTIQLERNLGFAVATNRGIAATDSKLVLMLNSDTCVTNDNLATLTDVLNRTPGVAAVGPRLVDASGTLELSFGNMLGPLNEFRQKLLGIALAMEVEPVKEWLRYNTHISHYPDWISGACLLAKRSCGDEVGWLDERFFLYGEDVDFCASLREAGYHILFSPDAEVTHFRGQSGSTAPAKTNHFYRQSQLMFYKKHHPRCFAALRYYLKLRGQLPTN